jgi:hypothetical protein
MTIERISNISAFKFNNSELLLRTINENLFFNETKIADNVRSFYFCNDNILYFKDGITYVYSQKEDIIINKITGSVNFESLKDGLLLVTRFESKGDKLYLYSFDGESFELIKEYKHTYIIGQNIRYLNCLIHRQGHFCIKCLSLETGEYNWTIDLSQYSSGKETVKIKEILGIWEDNLVVIMDNNDIIVLISLTTGEITGEIRHILAQFPKEGPWGFGWHFLLEGGYVYLLQQNRYLRIDLATHQIETLWIPENTNFNIQRVSYDEQYAYFMACDGYHVQTDILGVFDRKALKIVWQYDKPIGSSKPPQSDGNKLYCLDNEGTLHIFEKEKNE